ncbi:M81 family metallopeptidase [Microbacterium luteolum]|uniref:M81 family metallopeptidase n=1 Tax=Microbacterium luteolum TaxID=69367 RepID=A0ABY7XRX7_MICLT|nr:M81 family metallopeptidase [Microbacterium luteolum]WDM44802.1 M81 family metallopeptidase [Microbacterium luteolum]
MAETSALPRIAIAGMAIESSTFSPHRAGERDFQRVEGAELTGRYDAIRNGELTDRAEWLPVYYARSIPGGAVLPEVYESIKKRICEGLAALVADGGALDGLFFDIHGAMSVVGMDDAEGDLITAIREVIGSDVVVSASMDLHGNVSRTLIENVDLITCYRLAPHEDTWETRDRAIRNLVEALESGTTPHRAWVRVPILLPGEKTSTRVEPAKSLYARIPEIEARPGVTDAAIWIGYAWADEPRCHATVVVTGTDEAATAAAAEELGRAFWDVRDDFEFVGPPGTLDEGVAAGLAATDTPYFISDSGDNPGAGGTGDVTWTLAQLLQKPELTSDDAPVTLCASVFDKGALDILRRHAIGDEVSVEVGARVDDGPHGPVRVDAVLHSLHEGDVDAGGVAVLRRGGLHIIVTEFRKAYHAITDFTAIGLDPASAQIVVTKIGYLEPELFAAMRGWTLALTPGGVDQDLDRLGHHRILRPMHPFDVFAVDPDLAAEIVR